VAAIHPSGKRDGIPSFQFLPGGGFRAVNASLKLLIQVAYEVRPEQITGGDKWTDAEPYDVLAKPSEDAGARAPSVTKQVTLTRLQTLLSERFALSIKREPKTSMGYTLTVAKSGAKMTMAAESGSPLISQNGRWSIKAEKVPMSLLAKFLGFRLHVEVVDDTGLKGGFDFELQWKPDSLQDQNDPDYFDPAAVEQIGLKLNRQRIETDSYLIEHASTPTEN
jgi:uncharacterized protein (TIGR03435 family)